MTRSASQAGNSSSTSVDSATRSQGLGSGQHQSPSQTGGITGAFSTAFRDLFESSSVPVLFTGAGARVLYCSPAAMIFFACYESLTEVILGVRGGQITFNLLSLMGL